MLSYPVCLLTSCYFRFGLPIALNAYIEQFMSTEEGAPRAAVKRLTATSEQQLIEATINAPDW